MAKSTALVLVLALPLRVGAGRPRSTGCHATADVVIWGGTVCGATASVAASEGNASVLWLVQQTHVNVRTRMVCWGTSAFLQPVALFFWFTGWSTAHGWAA